MIEYLEMSNAMTLKLDQIQLQVEQLLKSFAQKGGLSQKILAPAFGADLDREKLSSLAQQFARGDISSWPKIEIRDGAELGGARGAYALEKDKIYLARKFIEQAPFQEIVEVLLEEIGHGVDAQVNTQDSAGDEGAIFSALVRGKDLTKAELAALQQEDDTVTLTIDGQILRAEAATLTKNTLNNVINNSDALAILWQPLAAAVDGDTITFASSLSGNTITLGGTELLIDKSLTIDGDLNNDGIGDITITANNSSRVFNINDGDNANDSNVILDGLTITGGSTIGDGGGILNYESLTITNSTVSGNSANANGGGIDNNGTLNITNSTVSGNSAGENGGGIFFQDFINLQSTIVADNIISSHVNSDIFNVVGTITASNSLIENGGFITNDEGNNIIGEDPLLDPNGLQDNGGPTLTIALQSGSPAINTGSNPNSLTTDQRGMGFSRTLGSGTDIGAFELNQTSTNIRSFKVVDVNEAPTDIQLSGVSIQENSANETVVGTLTADDPESDEVTFTLTNDAGGRFTIANDNKVQVADGASLNDD